MSQIIRQGVLLVWLVIIVTLVAAVLAYILIRKVLKNINKQATMEAVGSEANVNRKDITSYIIFDDIRDGILVLDGYKRFVSAITVQGYDLYHMSQTEQEQVMQGYSRFFDVLPDNKYIQLRFDPRSKDLDSYVNSYTESHEHTSERIYEKIETLTIIEKKLDYMEKEGTLATEEGNLFLEKQYLLQKEIESLTSQMNELAELATWTKRQTVDDYRPDMQSTYVINWSPQDQIGVFQEDLTDEEMLEKAKLELRGMADNYIATLSNAHVYAKQITQTEQKIDVLRSYFRPKTGDLLRVADIMKSSAMDYVTESETTNLSTEDDRTSYRIADAHYQVMQQKRERRALERNE